MQALSKRLSGWPYLAHKHGRYFLLLNENKHTYFGNSTTMGLELLRRAGKIRVPKRGFWKRGSRREELTLHSLLDV